MRRQELLTDEATMLDTKYGYSAAARVGDTLLNNAENCVSESGALPWSTAGVERVSATQQRILDDPGHNPLNVPPVHFSRSIQLPCKPSICVVHVPRLADVSGSGGRKTAPLGVVGGGVVKVEDGQQVIPLGPGQRPVRTARGQFSVRVQVPIEADTHVPLLIPSGNGQHWMSEEPGHKPVSVEVVQE